VHIAGFHPNIPPAELGRAIFHYSGCQKNVPISGRFFATNAYAAILFAERNYDKRYNRENDTLYLSMLAKDFKFCARKKP
jgi:hypothetical protein